MKYMYGNFGNQHYMNKITITCRVKSLSHVSVTKIKSSCGTLQKKIDSVLLKSQCNPNPLQYDEA